MGKPCTEGGDQHGPTTPAGTEVTIVGNEVGRDFIARTPARPAEQNTAAARTARRAAHRHGVLPKG